MRGHNYARYISVLNLPDIQILENIVWSHVLQPGGRRRHRCRDHCRRRPCSPGHLLEHGKSKLRDFALDTICALGSNARNWGPILTAGVLAPLVRCLGTGGLKLKERAAAALRNLAGDEDCRWAIAEAGAIAPLVQLLEKGGPGTRETAAGAIQSLIVDQAGKVSR